MDMSLTGWGGGLTVGGGEGGRLYIVFLRPAVAVFSRLFFSGAGGLTFFFVCVIFCRYSF